MPRPIYPETLFTRARTMERQVSVLARRGPSEWLTVGVDVDWQNGWADPTGLREPCAFRWNLHGDLEFKGDLNGVAATDPIAFYLPETHQLTTERNFTVPMESAGIIYMMTMKVSPSYDAGGDRSVSILPMTIWV